METFLTALSGVVRHGNSGGPALDTKGHIVGVLVSGGGENINFAIRIGRACATLRNC